MPAQERLDISAPQLPRGGAQARLGRRGERLRLRRSQNPTDPAQSWHMGPLKHTRACASRRAALDDTALCTAGV